MRRLNADAVTAMQKQGLQVVKGIRRRGAQAMEKSWSVVRGGVVPAEFFDEVKSARDACRVAKK